MMTFLLSLLLGCGVEGLRPAPQGMYPEVSVTDAFGTVHVDEQHHTLLWGPISGGGCDTTTQVQSGNEPGSGVRRADHFHFSATYNAAGRGAALPVDRSALTVSWPDAENPAIGYLLAESEVRLLVETATNYEFEFANGVIGTMVDFQYPTSFEVQVDPVHVSIEIVEGSAFDTRDAVSNGAADMAVDPETGTPICTR